MTVRFGDIVIECEHRQRAAEFSCATLGYRIVGSDHTGIAIAGDSSTDEAAPRLDRTSCGTRRKSRSSDSRSHGGCVR